MAYTLEDLEVPRVRITREKSTATRKVLLTPSSAMSAFIAACFPPPLAGHAQPGATYPDAALPLMYLMAIDLGALKDPENMTGDTPPSCPAGMELSLSYESEATQQSITDTGATSANNTPGAKDSESDGRWAGLPNLGSRCRRLVPELAVQRLAVGF